MDDYDYDYMSFNYDYPDFSGFDPSSFNFSDINFSPSEFSTFEFGFPTAENIDFSSFFDPTDISDFLGGSGGLDLSGIIDPTDLGMQSTDAEAQEGGFYGNTDSAYYDPRTNTTTLYNPDGTLRDTIVHDEREYDVEKQPGGFYGNTPNATYDPKTNLTTIRDNNGNVVRTVQGPPVPGGTTTNTITKTIQDVINRTTGGKENTQLLASLLGGLMGLLGKTNKPRDVGYQGGIPKYTAARTPGRGVQYTRAAGGGLMDLAAGGQPARYLRGGTDGMADKIKTSIDGKQPARLSHGEFVIPADVVSHLGNGNSDAGADVLYDMMAKVRKARTGNTKQGKQINPRKYTPA